MRQSAEPLSERQRAVLSLLERYRRERLPLPSLLTLAQEFRVHHSTMQEHLAALHRKGYLRAAVPGPPTRELPALPPLPIPERDEDDTAVEVATVQTPTGEAATVERRTLPGHSGPSAVVVRTRTRTSWMEVLRRGEDGPITGFKVVQQVEE